MMLRAVSRAVGLGRGRGIHTSLLCSLHASPQCSALQLKMPSLSPTMEEGTIVKWHKVG